MKLIVLVFLSLSLVSSCAGFIEKDFEPYSEQFIKDSKGTVSISDVEKIDIIFKKFPEKTRYIGLCRQKLYKKTILINKTWWNLNESIVLRKALIYHELGHCLLDRRHVSLLVNGLVNLLEDGCPVSLMNPSMPDNYCLYKHEKYYIKELFSK